MRGCRMRNARCGMRCGMKRECKRRQAREKREKGEGREEEGRKEGEHTTRGISGKNMLETAVKTARMQKTASTRMVKRCKRSDTSRFAVLREGKYRNLRVMRNV